MRIGFKEHLEATRHEAVRSLLHKAYVANRLAKLSYGVQRLRLYELKCRYLSQAIELSATDIILDSMLGSQFGIIGITTKHGYRFHVPLKGLSAAARAHFDRDSEVNVLDAAA